MRVDEVKQSLGRSIRHLTGRVPQPSPEATAPVDERVPSAAFTPNDREVASKADLGGKTNRGHKAGRGTTPDGTEVFFKHNDPGARFTRYFPAEDRLADIKDIVGSHVLAQAFEDVPTVTYREGHRQWDGQRIDGVVSDFHADLHTLNKLSPEDIKDRKGAVTMAVARCWLGDLDATFNNGNFWMDGEGRAVAGDFAWGMRSGVSILGTPLANHRAMELLYNKQDVQHAIDRIAGLSDQRIADMVEAAGSKYVHDWTPDLSRHFTRVLIHNRDSLVRHNPFDTYARPGKNPFLRDPLKDRVLRRMPQYLWTIDMARGQVRTVVSRALHPGPVPSRTWTVGEVDTPEMQSAVAGTRTADGGVDKPATAALLGRLPLVPADGLRGYVAAALGRSTNSIEIKHIEGEGEKGHTKHSANMVVDAATGQKLAVLKLFADHDSFVRETDAMQRVQDADLAGGVKGARVIAAARTPYRDDAEAPAVLMSLAPGRPLDDLLMAVRDAAPGERGAALATLREGVVGTARTLAALHTGPETSGQVPPRENLEVMVGKHHKKFDRYLVDDHRLAGLGIDRDRLRQYADATIEGARRNPGPNGFTHGDAHMGNFMYDPESGITMIDFGGVHKTINDEGQPVGEPAHDVAKFHQRLLETGQEMGLSRTEIGDLQHAFLKSYEAAGGAPVTREALRFFELESALWYTHKAFRDLKTDASGQPTPQSQVALQRGADMLRACMTGEVQTRL